MKDDSKYPAEFAHLQEKLAKTKSQLKQLDDQINLLQKDQGPELRFNPPGFLTSRSLGSRDQRMAKIEERKEEIQSSTLKGVEKDLKEADPVIASQIRNDYLRGILENPYKGKSEKDLRTLAKGPKDLELSQSLMDAQIIANQNKYKSPTRTQELPTLEDSQEHMNYAIDYFRVKNAGRQEKATKDSQVTASQRFSMSLRYSQTLLETQPLKARSKENRDKDSV